MPSALPTRPIDATLSVTKAARLLGVHPNTVRAWSDAGRLRYYRINPRGDRRYRLGDLQRFLAAAESVPELAGHVGGGLSHPALAGAVARRPFERIPLDALGTPEMLEAGRPEEASEGVQRADLTLLTDLVRIAGAPGDIETALGAACRAIRARGGHRAVVAFELRDERLIPRAASAPPAVRFVDLPRSLGSLGTILADAARGDLRPHRVDGIVGGPTADQPDVVIAIAGASGPAWGLLLVSPDPGGDPSALDADLLGQVAAALRVIVDAGRSAEEVRHERHRHDALRRVASDIGSRLDLDQILAGLVDHAMVLFDADRGAIFLRQPDGRAVAGVSRGLSQSYLASVVEFPARSLPALAVAARRPLVSVGYRDDPRAADVRSAVVQEGFDTICTAPLFDGGELLGLLNLYHDAPHDWTPGELETVAALADQAATALKNAQNYEKMATWAAQLQSIQQLGARLSRLTSDAEIGLAIATELRQLIDYHNVRVYRLRDDQLIPVAMHGQVGEYVDETPEQLMVRFGEGITGWVAEHRIPQNLPDAAADPRANTIPGTEDDLDESMILAPMTFEDQVIGVLVLSKLGLHQFSDDDLRLLVIYASFAAQAFVTSDATGRLRAQSDAFQRQLVNQRGLLQITESILTTLDPRSILDQVADRLSELVGYDNLSIETLDRTTGLLRPLTAKGIHADEYMEPWLPGEEGLATWVVSHNEPALVVDERSDDRVLQFRETGAIDGSLICVPLRGRHGATGVLTLERLGVEQRYTEDEFELVKLFAAQVSIALQNAEVHHEVEIRARTDDLTGLLNHGTFQDWLAGSVAEQEPFSLIMLDLDQFKAVNDELGHPAGDRFLAEMAQALVAAGRDSDHAFRYGGDEFALILPRTDAVSALGVAERVRAAVHAIGGPGTEWAEANLPVSASIGVATFPRDGVTAESILLAADRACFVAKRTGHGLIATADEGLAVAREFELQEPTPIDTPDPDDPPAITEG